MLCDPITVPVVLVFDDGGRRDGDPALAFVDLELIVAALVSAGGTEIPSPLDFDGIACFVLDRKSVV